MDCYKADIVLDFNKPKKMHRLILGLTVGLTVIFIGIMLVFITI